MTDRHHDGFEEKLDSLKGKAQESLGKFMEDQEKVDKAKAKAEDVLAKRVGQEQATEIVNAAEGFLESFAHRPEDQGKRKEE